MFLPRWRGLLYSFLTSPKSSSKAIIYKPLKFTTDSIVWEERLFVYYHARIEGVKEYCGIRFTPKIKLGRRVSIQQRCHITCAHCIEIGDNTAIASGVTITDIDHPYKDIYTPIERQPLEVASVRIGRDCKIYNNAVILKGSIIGNHCVVGANSVVKGYYPDFSIIAGCPARIIKRYNSESHSWEATHSDSTFITNNNNETSNQ